MILGLALGQSEEYASPGLSVQDRLAGYPAGAGAPRGLTRAQLVISDAQEGLKAAIDQVLAGDSWQRCRMHFMRNVLAHIPKGSKAMVAAALRTIFAQPDRAPAGQQLREAAQAMRGR